MLKLLPVLLAAGALMAQDAPIAAPELTPAQPKAWTFIAGLDSYGLLNTGHPDSGANQLRNFDLYSNSFNLNAASIGIEYRSDHFGAHFDGGYGDMFRTIAATDAWKGPNQYVMQGYVSYRPLTGRGLQFDVGKFYTSVGAEVADTLSNFNYSRSLAFTLGAPYYHFGVRATIPVTASLTAGVQVIDGVNDVTGRNDGKMLGLTSSFTKTKWGWNQVLITGSEKIDGAPAYRNLVDEVVTFSPRPSVQGYVELIVGRERRTALESANWYGAATSVRWTATKKLSFSPRIEYFGDPAGFTSGTAQHLRDFTFTADYKVHRLLTTRFEFRRDDSDRPVFEDGKSGSQRSQQTLLVGLLMAWKGER